MRKFILAAIALVFSLSIAVEAYSDSAEPTKTTVLIAIEKSYKGSLPRSVTLSPISCLYICGTLHFNFSSDIGQMTITVTNSLTGEQWFEMADAIDGSAEIAISDESGEYTILIETESGITYFGSFVL